VLDRCPRRVRGEYNQEGASPPRNSC